MLKSKFLTLFFSILPGAGHMYLGYMKRGLSLMTLFFVLCAGSSLAPLIGFAIPIVWFFGFFDALRLLGDMRVDGTIDDGWLFKLDELDTFFKGKTSTVCGVCLVGIGILGFYQYFLEYPLYELVRNIPLISTLVRNLPSLVLCVLFVILGVKLLGKRNEQY